MSKEMMKAMREEGYEPPFLDYEDEYYSMSKEKLFEEV